MRGAVVKIKRIRSWNQKTNSGVAQVIRVYTCTLCITNSSRKGREGQEKYPKISGSLLPGLIDYYYAVWRHSQMQDELCR